MYFYTIISHCDATSGRYSHYMLELHKVILFSTVYYNPLPFHKCELSNQTIYRICYYISNTTVATCGAGSDYPSGEPEITPSFWWGSCCLFFSFLCCVVCTIVCLFVFFLFSHGVVSFFIRFVSLTVPLVSFVPLL